MYSGERILPGGIFNVTYQQSLMAYRYVGTLARHKRILDVACGEGYGTAQLAELADAVTGVDRDENSVTHARIKYPRNNLTFLAADVFELPKKLQQRFDLVCCFQTIEHLDDHDTFLQTLLQLTKKGGRVVVSTPNRRMFPTFNPYHTHELDYQEVSALCRRHFSRFKIIGVFGNPRVTAYRRSKERIGRVLLRLDVFNLRHRLPRWVILVLYNMLSLYVIKRLSFWQHRHAVQAISENDFSLGSDKLERALDFIIVAEAQ